MIRVLCLGNWSASQVSVEWTLNSRRLVPEVESGIESAWALALARPGIQLFDGPMCRLESWVATAVQLRLCVAPSSYKAFLGTNMAHPEFSDRFGSNVMANPVGVSPALVTADRQLVLGRRTASVAYYPSRVHPFAGSMEPADTDPFFSVTRELHEELSLENNEIIDIRCTGIVADKNLGQPELIFAAETTRTLSEIESRLDPIEHEAIWAIPANEVAVTSAIQNDSRLTPVAIAALMLWGRIQIGQSWFEDLCDVLPGCEIEE